MACADADASGVERMTQLVPWRTKHPERSGMRPMAIEIARRNVDRKG